MIFSDSYQTTVGSVFVTKRIETAIKESIIKDGLDAVTLNIKPTGRFKPIFITGANPSESEIPLFTHPITIFNFNHQNYLCTDIRLYVREHTDISNIETGIKNLTEYNFVKSRTVLNLLWLNEDTASLKNSLPFASIVFSAWLSEIIAKTFALDYKDQLIVSIVTNFYYQTLFSDEKDYDDDTKHKMAVHTIKATNAPAEFVFSIFDSIGRITSVNDYITTLTSVTENVRLKNLNLPVLLTVIKNSWYGINAKEIISVALEHPPTWMAIVYTALTERTYKNSAIYRVAERFGKRGAADEFLSTYKTIVKDLTVATEEFYVRPFE